MRNGMQEERSADADARRHAPELLTRRRFSAVAGGALASLAFSGGACHQLVSAYPDDGRLTAQPRANVTTTAERERPLRLGSERDAILRVPAAPHGTLQPLLVLLHGASGSGAAVLRRLGSAPEDAGVVVLAPDSRESTWDVISGSFGADVAFINHALERVFDTVAVDPARTAVGGFSDGASYALSLGLINGDLFKQVVAFSPGFLVQGVPHGHARFFISHGTADPILPIDRCSRRIVPALQKAGYQVTFREFNGGHDVPPAIAHEGLQWIASAASSARLR